MSQCIFPGGFWAYSLHVYAQPGISETCITLQDSAGADVNMLLFALWAASRGQRLSPADFTTVQAHVQQWRIQIVQPLRSVRRALLSLSVPDAARRLRTMATEVELEAERQQQALMEPLLPSREPASAATLPADNLAAYAIAAGLALPEPAIVALAAATRTAPAFPE